MYTVIIERWGVSNNGRATWLKDEYRNMPVSFVRNTLQLMRWWSKMCRFQFVRVGKGQWQERVGVEVYRRIIITQEGEPHGD